MYLTPYIYRCKKCDFEFEFSASTFPKEFMVVKDGAFQPICFNCWQRWLTQFATCDCTGKIPDSFKAYLGIMKEEVPCSS